MRKLTKILLLLCSIYLLLSAVGGILLAESSLRLRHLPLRHRQQAEALVRQQFHTELQEISVTASDSSVLKGWYVHPRNFNGSTVVLLHGLTDNREGVGGYALLFLTRGYAVLLPDALAHSAVRVLLIHGQLDKTISPRHSEILAHAAPGHVQLWLVPKAWHTGAWSAAHDEFESRVLGWFSDHPAQTRSGS